MEVKKLAICLPLAFVSYKVLTFMECWAWPTLGIYST